MIKNLIHYTIPEIFEQDLISWQDMYTGKIIDDFIKLVGDLGLDEEVSLDYGENWQEDDGLWDLQLDIEGDFRGYIGNFYITWTKEENWNCTHIWFSGSKVDDDSDQEHWFWENK